MIKYKTKGIGIKIQVVSTTLMKPFTESTWNAGIFGICKQKMSLIQAFGDWLRVTNLGHDDDGHQHQQDEFHAISLRMSERIRSPLDDAKRENDRHECQLGH